MIRLLHDPTGRVPLAQLVASLNDPRSGRVAALLAPSPKKSLAPLADVLSALGKDYAPVAKRTGRTANLGSQLFVWLAAERINNLAIAGCENQHPENISDCAVLCEGLDIDLWLIAEGPLASRVTDALSGWSVQPTTVEEFRNTFVERPISEESREGPPPFPVVPTSTVLTFRSDARRTLLPGDFETVDTAYRSTFAATEAFYTACSSDAEKGSVIRHLVDLLVRTRDTNEQTTITRAVEAASICNDCFVKVDDVKLQRLLRGCAAPESLSDAQWADLGTASRPSDAAIAVLSAVGLTPREIAALPATDVSPTGDWVRQHGALIDIPEGGRNVLVAQSLAHVVFGNDECDRFLDDNLKDASAGRIASLLTRFSVHLGISLRRTYDSRETRSRVAWSAERALRFSTITRRAST